MTRMNARRMNAARMGRSNISVGDRLPYQAPCLFLPRLFLLCLFITFTFSSCSKNSAQESSESVTINLVHTPEISVFLESAAKLFALTNPTLPGNTPIKIALSSSSSISAANSISSGEIKTHGWLASSSALIDYVNSRRTNLGPQQIDCRQLFATPVVAAVQEGSRYKLNPTGNTFSWREFFSARSESNNKYSTSFMHLPPQKNVSGLASIMQLAYFSAVQSGEFINLESTNTKAALANFAFFESFVGQYPTNDFNMLSSLASFPSEKAVFALTTEQQLANFNKSRAPGTQALSALYPSEGSYWENYNLCLSDADWVSAAQRAGLRKFTDFLASDQMQLRVKQEGFRPYVVNIAEMPPLTKAFGVDTSLPTISLNPAPGDVVDFVLAQWGQIVRPSATMIVFDSSGSMDKALPYGQEKFRNWLAATSKRDLKGLISFEGEVDKPIALTADETVVIHALDSLRSIGGSAVYDAVKRAVEALSSQDLRPFRKNLVLFTDGGDKNSQVSIDLLADYVHHKVMADNISIFIIALTQPDSDFSDLKRIVKESGGIFREAYLSDMEPVFGEILGLL